MQSILRKGDEKSQIPRKNGQKYVISNFFFRFVIYTKSYISSQHFKKIGCIYQKHFHLRTPYKKEKFNEIEGFSAHDAPRGT